MRSKRVDEIRAVLARLGCEVLRIESTGHTHYRVRFRDPAGREHAHVTSSTPSDWRSNQRLRSQIRRYWRVYGSD